MSLAGPSWLGIGAQRSGTTWFTDLLTQHPEVCLPSSGRKELHAFDTAFLDGWTDEDTRAYRREFEGTAGSRPGEYTPFYLRALWVPALVQRVCEEDPVLVVLLRDPVDRFASGMRWFEQRPRGLPGSTPGERREWVRDRTSDALWAGMYAAHLEAWASTFPRERFVVQQYERAIKDPPAAVGRVWEMLGLDPVGLRDLDRPSTTSTVRPDGDPWNRLPGLRERLVSAYEPEVRRLEADWGVDRGLWPNFAPGPQAPQPLT